MTNRDLLKEIRRENKAMNRNLQRLINIGMIGMLGKIGHEAKESNDTVGRALAKTGLLLVAVSESLLMISEIIDMKKAKIEDRLEDMED